MSEEDIKAGIRWDTEVRSKLEESHFGILCLTPDNLNAPWLLFEAGALAKTVDGTYVCPYLVGLKKADLSGPLTQFQAKSATEQETLQLVESINSALKDKELSASRVTTTFSRWWPDLKKALESAPPSTAPEPTRTADEMIAELLTTTREMQRALNALSPAIGGPYGLPLRPTGGIDATQALSGQQILESMLKSRMTGDRLGPQHLVGFPAGESQRTDEAPPEPDNSSPADDEPESG